MELKTREKSTNTTGSHSFKGISTERSGSISVISNQTSIRSLRSSITTNIVNIDSIEVKHAKQAELWRELFIRVPLTSTAQLSLATSLIAKQRKHLKLATDYRKQQGDPIDNLVELLREFEINDEDWRNILDEPYG